MFCHNCGKDCGEFRFCPYCGTQLQHKDNRQTDKKQAAGMPCPSCGGTVVENGHCAFCGNPVAQGDAIRAAKPILPEEIPCGLYRGVTSSLQIYEKQCIVSTTLIFKKYETRIPFDKITSLVYVRAGTELGYLLFRWDENKDVPIRTDNNFCADKTTVTIAEKHDTVFYHLYHMLKVLVPATADCRMVIPSVEMPGLEEAAAQIELDDYFQDHAPYREQAVKAMCQRTGVAEDMAIQLVNRAFDERQQEIYRADPAAAVYDMNLIAGRKLQQEAQAAKERAKKKEQYKRDELLYELRRANREK